MQHVLSILMMYKTLCIWKKPNSVGLLETEPVGCGLSDTDVHIQNKSGTDPKPSASVISSEWAYALPLGDI